MKWRLSGQIKIILATYNNRKEHFTLLNGLLDRVDSLKAGSLEVLALFGGHHVGGAPSRLTKSGRYPGYFSVRLKLWLYTRVASVWQHHKQSILLSCDDPLLILSSSSFSSLFQPHHEWYVFEECTGTVIGWKGFKRAGGAVLFLLF